MTPLGNLTMAVATVLDMAINLMFLVLLARVVLSWIQPDFGHPVSQTVFALTEPLLLPIRRGLRRVAGYTQIDVSPIIAFFGLVFLRMFLVQTLVELAQTLTV